MISNYLELRILNKHAHLATYLRGEFLYIVIYFAPFKPSFGKGSVSLLKTKNGKVKIEDQKP